jgi:hypothetical protein
MWPWTTVIQRRLFSNQSIPELRPSAEIRFWLRTLSDVIAANHGAAVPTPGAGSCGVIYYVLYPGVVNPVDPMPSE